MIAALGEPLEDLHIAQRIHPGAELARLRSRPDWIQALARRTGVTTSFVEER